MTSQQWTPNAPIVRQPHTFLDNLMLLVMIVAGLMIFAGMGIVMVDGDPGGAMAVGAGLVLFVLSGLGRVLIGIARTVEDIGENARVLRGFEEWRMQQQSR